MLFLKNYLDVHVSPMLAAGRWFGINRVSRLEGSIGLGFAEVVYSLGGAKRALEARRVTERVEPGLSSRD